MKKKLDFVNVIIYLLLTVITIVTIYPLLNLLAVSLSEHSAYVMNPLMVIPDRINLLPYKWVFSHPLILSSYKNTLIVTFVGTFFSMFLTSTLAYPLSNRGLRGKGLFMKLIIFTMMFNGGLIPNFYLVRSLGLLDKLWALIIPGSMSGFYVILMKNFFESIPGSLKEAAKIDGASEMFIFARIVIPLSAPILSTLSLFYAVLRWNSFFNAIVYIRDRGKWTLQLLLREIVIISNPLLNDDTSISDIPPENIKYAVIIVAIVPILCLYPFLQKYFVKGIMVGAVKG